MADNFHWKTIAKKKLILAEGTDDCHFLSHLLRKMEIDDVQISDFNGVENLTRHIETLKGIEGFETVVSILVFRDAEKSTQSTCQSVNYSLKETGLIQNDIKPFTMSSHNGRNVGFALFPGFDEHGELCGSGTLEHLCLRLFKSGNALVKGYLDDFRQHVNAEFRRPHKNELHALFSFTDDYVGLKIGETARNGGFDFDSPYLLPFLKMIKEM